jgi:hypothetical protein
VLISANASQALVSAPGGGVQRRDNTAVALHGGDPQGSVSAELSCGAGVQIADDGSGWNAAVLNGLLVIGLLVIGPLVIGSP